MSRKYKTNIIVGIYKIRCTKTKKEYIGSSNNIKRRWKEHISHLNRNRHKNKILQKDWNKYGQKYFKFIILQTVRNFKRMPIREKYWIKKLQTLNTDLGYNIGPVTQRNLNTGIKLSAKNVYDIKNAIFNGIKIAKLATKYKIHRATIISIKYGRTWKHVKFKYNIAQREQVGEKHARTKLKNKTVLKIKQDILNDKKPQKIAEQYKISVEIIYNIRLNKSWKNIGPLLRLPKKYKPNAKINKQQAKDIRNKLSEGVSCRELATLYNIHINTIYSIKQNRVWKRCGQKVKHFIPRNKGASHINAKINESIAKQIKIELKTGSGTTATSKKLNIPYNIVNAIKHNRSWKYIRA